MACGEFSLIARYFDRVRTSRLDVETGIGDDCALLNIEKCTVIANAGFNIKTRGSDTVEITGNQGEFAACHTLCLSK